MSDTPRTDEVLEQYDSARATMLTLLSCTLERELNAAKAGRCDWKEDEDGNWNTSCKQCMVFEYAPPHEQGYNFCHHCGKTICYIKFTPNEDNCE
jgi:hypothetical protein